VLQVASLEHAGPIVFGSDPDADILSADTRDLHSYGNVFKTLWVTIHDTKKDGTAAFDANAAAKKAGGTPFKRPENGVFKPGTGFKKFFFTETGDTTLTTEAGTSYGGFGAIQELWQDPKSDKGSLRLFYQSDKTHSSFDNITFFDKSQVIAVQDQGDGLHSSLNALDSAFMFDAFSDYSGGAQPVKVIAEGRDPSATIDSAIGGISGNGFNNEGDNEITGIHESNGDPTADGLLGAAIPKGLGHGWRLFFTHQHGDNVTSEVIPA
jgi:secreted PhoX family phosphatase